MGLPGHLSVRQTSRIILEAFDGHSRYYGINKVTTSSSHPYTTDKTERVNHTMTQMLAAVVNKRQNDSDIRLPHVELACSDSVNQATGLAPNEIHIGCLCRLSPSMPGRPSELGLGPNRV